MKRFLAITLVVIFVAGQLNLIWAEHFCMDHKVKTAVLLGTAQLDCGMGAMVNCEEEVVDTDGPVIKAPDCCYNKFYSSESDDQFDKSESVSIELAKFITSFVVTYQSFFPENDAHISVVDASPPLIQYDRQIQYQSFLL